MRKNKRVLAVLLSAAMTIASLTSGGTGGVPARAATSTSSFQDLNQQQITEAMGVGYNLGNSLEASKGGTPSETEWGNPKLTEQFVLAAKSAGFQSIRIPVSYLSKIDDNNGYQIDSAWLDRVQEVVDYCVKNDMYAIVNMHGDGYTTVEGGWLLCGSSDQTKIREKYKACWQQIATRFKDYDEHLIFESMNEEFDGTYGDPNRTYYENINTYNQIFVDTVRQTGGNNDKRWLLIPGWNTDINYTVGDYGFALPTDQYLSSGVAAGEKRIMISVHYYAPWEFCGTESQAVTQWGSKATDSTKKASWGDESYMASQFKKLKDKFVSQGYPVVIGEFGAINKSSIDSQNTVCRADFYQKVCYYAKQNGLVPVAWDNGYNGVYGFCLINRSTNTVAHPEVVNAVMEIYRATSTATGISLDKDQITVSVGDVGVQLNASLTPADSKDLISWSSDDDTVATVSSSGLVTAVGAGSCTITASVAGGYKAECKVTVPKPTYIRTKLYMMNTNDWGTTVSEESADITTADQEYTMTLKVTDTQLQNIGSLYLKDIQATEPEDSPISYASLKVKSISVNGKEYSMNNSVFTYNSSLKSTTGKANNVFDFAFVNIWAITYVDDVTTESKKAYFNGVSYQGTNTISMTFEVSDVKANETATPSATPSSTPKVTASPSTTPSSTPDASESPYIRTKLYMMNMDNWGTTTSEESADITMADRKYTLSLEVTDEELQNIGILQLKDVQGAKPEDSPFNYAVIKVKSVKVNGKEYSMNNSAFTYNSSLESATGTANNVLDFAFINTWSRTSYIDDVTTESMKSYFNDVSYQGTNTISMTFEVSGVKANETETPSAAPSSTPKVTTSPSATPSSVPSPSQTPSPSSTPSPSQTPSPSSAPTPSRTPSAEPSQTPSPSSAPSPSQTPSAEPSQTPSPSSAPSPSQTPSAEPSQTPAPSDTAQPSAEPSQTPAPGETDAPSAEPSETPAPSDTAQPSAEPSQTPAPGETDVPSATPSQTPAPSDTTTPSATPSQTPKPGNTTTPSATPSRTPAPGNTKAPGTSPSATPGTNGDDSNTVMSFILKASVKGVKNLSVGAKYKLAAGKKMTLSADFITDTDDQEVSFTSSKSSVVKVDENGVVKAGKKTGKAVITVTAADGTSRKVTVQVMKKAVKKLAIKKGSRSLKKGKKLKLKVQAKPGKKLASDQYYWKTSSAKKATVSTKGIVKAKQKGTVKITVYATDGSGKKASVKLQVK